MSNTESLANKAEYYWTWFLRDGNIDNLIAAFSFMVSYRKAGGKDRAETESAMNERLNELCQ